MTVDFSAGGIVLDEVEGGCSGRLSGLRSGTGSGRRNSSGFLVTPFDTASKSTVSGLRPRLRMM
jgi:hypothetical protein